MTVTDRARRYIGVLPRAVSGSGGHTSTFAAALALVKGFGLPEHVALDELRAWNLTHADPPWNDTDLRHKIRSAAQTDRRLGYLLDNASGAAPRSTSISDDEIQSKAEARKSWPTFQPLSAPTLAEIAALRHLPLEAVHIVNNAALVAGAMVDGHRCFVIREGTFAQARRLEGGKIATKDGGETKAKTLWGSTGHFVGRSLLGGQGVGDPRHPLFTSLLQGPRGTHGAGGRQSPPAKTPLTETPWHRGAKPYCSPHRNPTPPDARSCSQTTLISKKPLSISRPATRVTPTLLQTCSHFSSHDRSTHSQHPHPEANAYQPSSQPRPGIGMEETVPGDRFATEPLIPMDWSTFRTSALAALLATVVPVPLRAEATAPAEVRAFFEQHCLKCHSGEKPKGDLTLEPLLRGEKLDAATLGKNVLEKIETGEMPPKSKPRPAAEERLAAADWLVTQIGPKSQGRTVMRRLNRVEYENTLRDLLGVRVRVRELLPPDAAAGGFDNVGEALHISSFLLERYLEAADEALEQAIANGPQPQVKKEHVTLDAAHQVKQSSEKVFRRGENGRITMFSSSPWQSATLFWLEKRGRYRFRLSVSAAQSEGKPVVFSAHTGGRSDGAQPELAGYFDAPAGEPKILEFEAFMEPQMWLNIRPYGLATGHEVENHPGKEWPGPGLAIDWVENEGPLNDQWPPASHERLFGVLKQTSAASQNQSARAKEQPRGAGSDEARILSAFARRAFRRPVSNDKLVPYTALVAKRTSQGSSFQQAMRAGLAAVMTSPQFLYLNEAPGRLDKFAVASRLSYFLWSSMPDDKLIAVAESGKLTEPAVLRAQTDRLLQSPKASAFTENFTGQWLRLRELDATEPSHLLYPEFDEMLKVSMMREVHLFFDELLRHDLSLTNFLASDFSMLNGRLARHYGIPGVDGWAFKRVALPPNSHRGGVLTMAAVLKVTANGTNTSPVLRGTWVLDSIFGQPPKPPPPDAGSIEPDIRGATTIREQLDKHRRNDSCASCHVKIDPPGFALENFDVIGGWREFYRSTGTGKEAVIDGQRMPWLHGPAVDATGVTPDGQRFSGVDDFKNLLLADPEPFARALTVKLITYATGAAVEATDQREVTAILARAKAAGWGFRSLLHEIVQSRLFLEK